MENFKLFSKMGAKMKELCPKGMSMKEFANYNPMEDGKRMTDKQLRIMQSMIPPAALHQMGGTAGLVNMMKQLANIKKKG